MSGSNRTGVPARSRRSTETVGRSTPATTWALVTTSPRRGHEAGPGLKAAARQALDLHGRVPCPGDGGLDRGVRREGQALGRAGLELGEDLGEAPGVEEALEPGEHRRRRGHGPAHGPQDRRVLDVGGQGVGRDRCEHRPDQPHREQRPRDGQQRAARGVDRGEGVRRNRSEIRAPTISPSAPRAMAVPNWAASASRALIVESSASPETTGARAAPRANPTASPPKESACRVAPRSTPCAAADTSSTTMTASTQFTEGWFRLRVGPRITRSRGSRHRRLRLWRT